MCPTDAATERFVYRENLILLRKRFSETIDAVQRNQILTLLGEEEGKTAQLPPNIS